MPRSRTIYVLTIKVPTGWVDGAEDMRTLLEEQCNLWSVTHCDGDIGVEEHGTIEVKDV